MPAAAVESAADVPRSSRRSCRCVGGLGTGLVVRFACVSCVLHQGSYTSYSYVSLCVLIMCPSLYVHVCVCQRHNCVSYNPLPCVLCVSYVCPGSPRCLCIVTRAPGTCIHAPSGDPSKHLEFPKKTVDHRHDAAPLRGVCALQPTIRRSAAASHAMLATEWGFRPRRPM